jgi:two-component system, OmpR family, KDP operon response regulator KdpE
MEGRPLILSSCHPFTRSFCLLPFTFGVALQKPIILVIDDEPAIRHFLRTTMAAHGYELIEASDGQEGIAQVASRQPAIVLLDLGLPDIDGLEVTLQLRAWTKVPIIVLSARGQERDKVAALEAGADDYLTKPFGVAELMARMRVALRHTTQTPQEAEGTIFHLGQLHVDLARRQVLVGDSEIHLTPIEYKLLTTLIRHAGKVITQGQLLREVWGPGYATEAHYLRVYMGQLRHKLEAEPARPRYLITEPGVGYRLRVDDDTITR